jgi:hypothetical protein
MIATSNEPSPNLAARLGFAPLRQMELTDGDVVQLPERLLTTAVSV